jgi:hypothetical protein
MDRAPALGLNDMQLGRHPRPPKSSMHAHRIGQQQVPRSGRQEGRRPAGLEGSKQQRDRIVRLTGLAEIEFR